jgi:hypothetical protein
MKILAIEKELSTMSTDKAVMEQEAYRVYELYKMDKLREIYFTKEKHTAVIIFEVEGLTEAWELVNSLPLVKNNVIDFDLLELIPYHGVDRLIEK